MSYPVYADRSLGKSWHPSTRRQEHQLLGDEPQNQTDVQLCLFLLLFRPKLQRPLFEQILQDRPLRSSRSQLACTERYRA